jgi:hypothetical protein
MIIDNAVVSVAGICLSSNSHLTGIENPTTTCAGSPSKGNPFRKHYTSLAARVLFKDFSNKKTARLSQPTSSAISSTVKRMKHQGLRLLAEARACRQNLSLRSYHMDDLRGYGSSDGEWRDYLLGRLPINCAPRRSLRIARLQRVNGRRLHIGF